MRVRIEFTPSPGRISTWILPAYRERDGRMRIASLPSRLFSGITSSWLARQVPSDIGSIATLTIPGDGPGRLVLLHVPNEASSRRWRRGIAAAARAASGTDGDVGIWLPGLPPAYRDPAELQRAATAIHEGVYRFSTATRTPPPHMTFRFVGPSSAPMRAAIRAGDRAGAILDRTRDLANTPGNLAGPDAVVAYARRMARKAGLRCTVWDAARLERERCHALLAVGRGSRRPPRLIQLRCGPAAGKPIVLVGKTITFDSGGLSLKTAKGMETMKFDKCGGMAVLAAMEILAGHKLPFPVVGILAVAENMPGGDAMRPGDIVRARNGRTIEILNTDAEGRLVLADALDVACELNPRFVVDIATLTGAVGVALGKAFSAMLARRSAHTAGLAAAGDRTGEWLWSLPLPVEYRSLLRSSFADLKNIGDGSAGCILGGVFLDHFVRHDVPWCHIDLSNAWEESDQPHMAAGATLFGALLLVDWLTVGPLTGGEKDS